MVMEDK